jgi:hypothetical protein
MGPRLGIGFGTKKLFGSATARSWARTFKLKTGPSKSQAKKLFGTGLSNGVLVMQDGANHGDRLLAKLEVALICKVSPLVYLQGKAPFHENPHMRLLVV